MKDTIYRQDVIDALNKLDVSDGVGISSIACNLQEEAIRSIKSLPPAQPNWTPCSEQSPNKNGIYLVTYLNNGKLKVDWNIWNNEPEPSWFWNWNIMAWMPLPEPYAERWRG